MIRYAMRYRSILDGALRDLGETSEGQGLTSLTNYERETDPWGNCNDRAALNAKVEI